MARTRAGMQTAREGEQKTSKNGVKTLSKMTRGKRKNAVKGKTTSTTGMTSSRRGRTVAKKSSSSISTTKDVKQKTRRVRRLTQQMKQTESPKRVRRIIDMMIDKHITASVKKQPVTGRSTGKGRREKAQSGKILRQIDRLRAAKKEKQPTKMDFSMSGVMTRGMRRNLLDLNKSSQAGEIDEASSEKEMKEEENKKKLEEEGEERKKKEEKPPRKPRSKPARSKRKKRDDLETLVEAFKAADDRNLRGIVSKMKQYTRGHFKTTGNPLDNATTIARLGCLPRLTQILKEPRRKPMHQSVIWILINVACGPSEQTKPIYESGLVPHLIAMMASKNTRSQLDSIMLLHNLAGDRTEYRDGILEAGVTQPLLSILHTCTDLKVLYEAVCLLLNFFLERDPPPPDEMMLPFVEVLHKQLYNTALPDQTLRYVCIAVKHIVTAFKDSQTIIAELRRYDNSICSKLMAIASVWNNARNALDALAAMSGVSEELAMAVVNAGFLAEFPAVMDRVNLQAKGHALRCLRNIVDQKLTKVVMDSGVLPFVVSLLANQDFTIASSSLQTLRAFFTVGTDTELKAAMELENFFAMVCGMLPSESWTQDSIDDASWVLLTSLRRGCREGSSHPYIPRMQSCGGFDRVRNLKESGQVTDPDVRARLFVILEEFDHETCKET